MAPSASKVFVSYNRADRDWAVWIAGEIEPAGYEPIIQAWDFRPGQNFVLRMQQAMTEADITIAVLSNDYLEALYTQPEWAAAIAKDPTGRQRKLIPVRVAPCSPTGMLSQIIYIDLVGLGEQDAKCILLEGLRPSGRSTQPLPFPGERAEPSVLTAPFPPTIARLHGVPGLPHNYLPRADTLVGLKQKLLASGAKMGLQGIGATDKSILVAALLHDSEVRQAFPDGIYWLTIGQNPNILFLQSQLLRQLGVSEHHLNTVQEAKDSLREALESRRALMVLDDVWTVKDADAFCISTGSTRLLITARSRKVLTGLGAEVHRIRAPSLHDTTATRSTIPILTGAAVVLLVVIVVLLCVSFFTQRHNEEAFLATLNQRASFYVSTMEQVIEALNQEGGPDPEVASKVAKEMEGFKEQFHQLQSKRIEAVKQHNWALAHELVAEHTRGPGEYAHASNFTLRRNCPAMVRISG
jgi:hypothetical protein